MPRGASPRARIAPLLEPKGFPMNRTGRLPGPRGAALVALAAGLLSTLAGARPAPAEEAWDIIRSGGHKIGYVHTLVKPMAQKHKGHSLLNVQVNQVLTFKRNKDVVSMQVRLGTIETTEGEVLKVDYRTLAGPTELKNSGDVEDGKLKMTFEAGNLRQQQVIDWPAEVRGPYAVEQSLARKPMEPGEERQIKSFLPVINEVCTLTLTARAWEDVTLPAGKTVSLLKVDTKVTGPDGKSRDDYDQTYWFDRGGQSLKSFAPMLGGIEIYRTTREAAKAQSDGQFDIVKATLVKVRAIPRPESTREVLYRITATGKGEDASALFPTDRRQAVRRESTTTALLTVRRAGPDAGPAGPAAVDDKFLRANPLVNSEDPKVVELMNKAIVNARTPWQKAAAIERWVFQNIKEVNYRTAFATASEVAADLAGDCTEHSVLMAAMCRAAGIPCRVVTGLLYAEPLGGFGGHMWNEVYVNGRWVALDSAWDQSEVDAVHLKLSDTSLDGTTPFDALLPILQVSGKIKIEPLEIR